MIEVAEIPVKRSIAERTCNQCGMCCEDVQLPWSPEDMEAILRASGDITLINVFGHEHKIGPGNLEHRQIAEMLEFKYAGHVKWIEGQGQFGKNEHVIYHYRCRNFSRDTEGRGVCGIYETRPKMCQIFPAPHDRNLEEYLQTHSYPSQYAGCSYNVDDRPMPFIESETIDGV